MRLTIGMDFGVNLRIKGEMSGESGCLLQLVAEVYYLEVV